jgi:hypothetical protein
MSTRSLLLTASSTCIQYLMFIIMQIESTSSSNWSPLAVRRRSRQHRKRAHFIMGGLILPIVLSCDRRASEVLGSQTGHWPSPS